MFVRIGSIFRPKKSVEKKECLKHCRQQAYKFQFIGNKIVCKNGKIQFYSDVECVIKNISSKC